jgi:hypothetical protein
LFSTTLLCGILLAVLQEAWFKAENTSELRHWYSQPTGVWPDVEGGRAWHIFTTTSSHAF